MDNKVIVGIHIGETAGVALYSDGKIIYAASEERFSRKKNDLCYPSKSLKNLIDKFTLSPDKIEKIVVDGMGDAADKFLVNPSSFSIEDWVKEENEWYFPLFYGKENDNKLSYMELFEDKCKQSEYQDLYNMLKENPEDYKSAYRDWRINRIKADLGVSEDQILFLNHEYSHAAYAFYGSPWRDFDDVLCVVFDGWGDESNASIYTNENGIITQLKKYQNFNIGRLYRFMTLLLGMKPLEHEYKVMGLAPYATEYIYKKPLEVFRKAYDFIDGEVVIDPELKDNYFYFRKRLEGMRFDGIAAGLQILTEEMIKKLVSFWLAKTGKKRVVLSGGVSLNVKANLEVGKMPEVNDIFVPGSGGDESHCMGLIFLYLNQQGRGSEIEPMTSLFLGDEVDNEDVLRVLKKAKDDGYYVEEKVSPEHIALKLSEGYVLGRIAGRMEFGARALGNRSILADPRKQEIVARINRKIKNRDFWMPFTPSILQEDAEKILYNPKGFCYPYMTVGCETTVFGRKNIPAAIHPADYTARPEVVTKDYNIEYYNIIKAFKSITGVGALLNTSLNLHGYPIVRTASEAYFVFENSDLDGLIIEDNLVLRKRNS